MPACSQINLKDPPPPHPPLHPPTYDALGEGGPLERGQAQVPDLHGARGAGDEDVVTLQVPVDDGRGPGVQEVEAFKDLTAPRPQNLDLHHLEALQVAGGRENRRIRP